ncbi:hypothetical protein LCGC14_2172120 [marine sediment metagenome]|uniref:Uncharacterized protein n=1 Tax=marine sediment metagenome TaxID=412755 RepID=A0A0F9DPM0_9ZZZZ
METISMKLLGKTFYYINRGGNRELWGKIIDYIPKQDKFLIYKRNNPDGYRTYTHSSDELRRFIDDKNILV